MVFQHSAYVRPLIDICITFFFIENEFFLLSFRSVKLIFCLSVLSHKKVTTIRNIFRPPISMIYSRSSTDLYWATFMLQNLNLLAILSVFVAHLSLVIAQEDVVNNCNLTFHYMCLHPLQRMRIHIHVAHIDCNIQIITTLFVMFFLSFA